MRQIVRAAVATCLLLVARSANLRAQDSTHAGGPSNHPAKAQSDSAAVRFAKYRQYPWNGINVWAGSSYETRSASHNEHIAGSLRVVGLQISRDVWRGRRTRIAYLGEVLPVMHVRSGPPLNRIPDTLHIPQIQFDQKEYARFTFREGYGFGLAPFGAEASVRTSRRTSALFNVTAGGLIFTQVVPYGAATKANFTVSPGVAFQWEPQSRTRIALGYTFHHLSNASLGRANPGLNSQILYVRVSRLRPGLESR